MHVAHRCPQVGVTSELPNGIRWPAVHRQVRADRVRGDSTPRLTSALQVEAVQNNVASRVINGFESRIRADRRHRRAWNYKGCARPVPERRARDGESDDLRWRFRNDYQSEVQRSPSRVGEAEEAPAVRSVEQWPGVAKRLNLARLKRDRGSASSIQQSDEPAGRRASTATGARDLEVAAGIKLRTCHLNRRCPADLDGWQAGDGDRRARC